MVAAPEDSCSLGRDGARLQGETQGSPKRDLPILRPRKKLPCPGCSEALALILEAVPRQQWLLCLGSSGGGEEFTRPTGCRPRASHPAPRALAQPLVAA